MENLKDSEYTVAYVPAPEGMEVPAEDIKPKKEKILKPKVVELPKKAKELKRIYKHYGMIMIFIYILLSVIIITVFEMAFQTTMICGVNLESGDVKCQRFNTPAALVFKASLFYMRILITIFNVSYTNRFLSGNIFQYVAAIVFPEIYALSVLVFT